MNLGFIGTGKIASSVIEGIFKSSIKINNIYISPRNKYLSKKLEKKYKKIIIARNNQEIIDNSKWVFLSVTPEVGKKIITKLKFKNNQLVISFISSIKHSELKKLINKKVTIIRAIPLPPISLKKGPVPIFPPNKKVKIFFNHLGTAVEIQKENSSLNFWSTSGMMAPFYELLNCMSTWLIKRGIKKDDAQKYITSLFVALSQDAVIKSKKDLKYLVKESQTPRGLNEQGVKELKKAGIYRSVEKTLNSILKRLNKV